MRQPAPVPIRTDDLLRHLDDLRTDTHEGAAGRADREAVYRRAVELLEPVARSVLEAANAAFLEGTGEVRSLGPEPDGSGGLVASFELSWPAQREARVIRGPDRPLQPVRIVAWFASGFTHPHLSGATVGHWPLQVTSPADAERQAGVLGAIVEAELHQRVFEAGWRVLPVAASRGGREEERQSGS